MNIDKILEDMRITFKDRNERYSENWRSMGPIMTALYPEGIILRTEEDFVKFSLFEWALGKFVRFARTGHQHQDSLLDAAVYLCILNAYLDENKPEED